MISSVSSTTAVEKSAGTKKPAQIMYGDEFRAQMEVLWDKVRAERAAGKTGAGQERRKLTPAEIKELAAKYDPSNMSTEEFDAFIKELEEKNALTKQDASNFGCGSESIVLGLPGELCTGYIVSGSEMGDWASRIKTLVDAEGDALLWTRLMSLWKPHGGTEAAIKAAEERRSVFENLAGILALMKDA